MHCLPIAPPPPETLPPPPSPLLRPVSPPRPSLRSRHAQDANIARLVDPKWYAALTWKYFFDAPDAAAGCLFCGQEMRAAPSVMALHIVCDCRVADHMAMRALRSGRSDPFIAPDAAGASPVRCLEVAVDGRVGPEAWRAPALLLSKDVDYVAVLEGDVAAICAPLDTPKRLSYKGSRYPLKMQKLADEAKRAEETITAWTQELDSFVRPSPAKTLVGASACGFDQDARAAQPVPEPDDDDNKENVSPQRRSLSILHAASTARKRGLDGRRRRTNKKKLLKLHESSKKRLFSTSGSSSVFSDEMAESPVRAAAPVSASASPASVPATCDELAFVRSLARACVIENVPVSCLSSMAFESALKSYCGVLETVDVGQLAADVVEDLAEPADEISAAMRVSASRLTLCVNRASRFEPGRAVVYLVDERAQSALISCQKDTCEIASTGERAAWLDEVQRYYSSVVEWCGRPLHLCVADYPAELRFELQAQIGASPELALLVGGCMAQEFGRLRELSLRLLRGAPEVVKACVELALLVNEAEEGSSQPGSSSPLRLSVPLTHDGDQLFGFAVLLKQVVCMKRELETKFQCAAAPGVASSARRILDSLHDQWATVTASVELLLPFAAAELITSAVGAAPLTSGVFFGLELWLFAAVAHSPLLLVAEKARWKAQFVQRQRATRLDHQLAGLLLDPRLAGVGLSPSGRHAAQAFVVEICKRACPTLHVQSLASQLVQFVTRSGAFAARELWQDACTAEPVAFWRRVRGARELQEVALLVCSYAPASPSTSDAAMPPSTERDFSQATRAAQIQHHLRAQERVASAPRAMELLAFLTSDEGDRSVRSLGPDLLLHPAFAWTPVDAATKQQAIDACAQTFARIVEDAARKPLELSDEGADARWLTRVQQLRHFSTHWVDSSAASLRALRRAVGRVSSAREK